MPIGALPIGDIMLAQEIGLEMCESEARHAKKVYA